MVAGYERKVKVMRDDRRSETSAVYPRDEKEEGASGTVARSPTTLQGVAQCV